MRRALVCLVFAVALGACASRDAAGPGAEERAAIAIDAEHALVKSGPIGFSDKAPGSYALVDATNHSDKDRMVTVDAQLVDATGKPLAPIAGTSLRIPAGQTRTFALVADRTFPEARGVKASLRGATALDYPPQVSIDDPGFAPVQAYTVATGTVRNLIDKVETATLAATFYDAGGRILARPAAIVELPVGASRPLRFEGPKEATRAVVFVAEVVFPQ